MDIPQRKFQTVSHCVDLENDSGKKVLVSVSICHIVKCDGCDPSGQKGLHKTSCAWNILTNESCQVHEVNSKGCPIHDTILRSGVAIAQDKQDNGTTSIVTSPDEEVNSSEIMSEHTEIIGQHETVSNESDNSTPEITINTNLEPNEEKDVNKENSNKSQKDPPDPPKDDGGSGGGSLVLQSDGLLSPDIPLEDASNIQNIVSTPVVADSFKCKQFPPTSIGTSLNFEQIQKHSGGSTCSYVYVDKLGENLSTRLPNIITEALASSTLHLKDENSIPECLYEPYQKITALTLEKIQQLKNRIYNSSDTSAQVSTDIYKVHNGEAIYVGGKERLSKERDNFLFRPENLVTIENPNIEYSEENLNVNFEEIDEGTKKCPLCSLNKTKVDVNVSSSTSNNAEMMQDSKSTYDQSDGSSFVENIVNEMGRSATSEEPVNANTDDIIIDQLSEFSNSKCMLNGLKSQKKVRAEEFPNPIPIYNISNRPYERYIHSLTNEKKMITTSKLLEVNNLKTEHTDILTTHNTYRDPGIEEHSFLKSIGRTVDNSKTNSCNCVKNKFHSCGHSKNLNFQGEYVCQMIQTDEARSKHTDGEEDELEEDELKEINLFAKKELSDENYKLLTHIIEKVKQNAAEVTNVLKFHNLQDDSTQEFLTSNAESSNSHDIPNVSGTTRQRTKKKLTYGSKLVLSPELPNEQLHEDVQFVKQLPDETDNSLLTGKISSLYVNLYNDIICNSSFLKSLIPPISSNGLFSDAVECHLNEQKRSLIPWLISLFIPTCECTTSKDKQSLE